MPCNGLRLYEHSPYYAGMFYIARGRNTAGVELIEEIMDKLRRQAEDCTSLQGLILHHSAGGGTGAGLTSMILERMSHEYGQKSKVRNQVLHVICTNG